jgi:hypothetical protein
MEEIIQMFGSIQLFILFLFLTIWSLVWKIFAVWKAVREGAKPWYIAMMILNTAGILEIIYIFFVSRRKRSQKEE